MTKKEKQQGRSMLKDNQYKICDAYARQGKVQKMIQETYTFNKLLLEDGEYAKVEENLLWLSNNKGVTPEQQIELSAKIYEIDRHYNPFTKIEPLFASMYALAQSVSAIQDPSMVKLAEKAMDFLEKQSWKKDIYGTVQGNAP